MMQQTPERQGFSDVQVVRPASQLEIARDQRLAPRPLAIPGRVPKKRISDYVRFGSRGAFFLWVLLPGLLAGGYYFGLASRVYVSEAEFVVRVPDQPMLSGLGALFKSAAGSGERVYVVVDYLKSRDALRSVQQDVHYSDTLSRPGIDFIAKFPNFYSGGTFEDLYDKFNQMVSVIYDSSAGTATLQVRAFEPDDAHNVAEALLVASERLVNRMNERSLADSVSLAEGVVDRARDRLATVQQRLTEYRVTQGVIDPSQDTRGAVAVVATLGQDLANTEAQLAQTRVSSPQGPQVRALEGRVTALQQQIEEQRAKVVGPDGKMPKALAAFERLKLDEDFAQKALIGANSALENARADALRKQVYLERISGPSLPDDARFPKRIVNTLTVLAAAFIAYAIIWLFVANVREHAT